MTKPCCPGCGGDEHVYARADLRWNPDTQSWDFGVADDLLDCMECDESFYASEADFPPPSDAEGTDK